MDDGGRAIVCRVIAGPGKSTEFILSRLNLLNTAGMANRHITKYMC
jgi:hypothetical protein